MGRHTQQPIPDCIEWQKLDTQAVRFGVPAELFLPQGFARSVIMKAPKRKGTSVQRIFGGCLEKFAHPTFRRTYGVAVDPAKPHGVRYEVLASWPETRPKFGTLENYYYPTRYLLVRMMQDVERNPDDTIHGVDIYLESTPAKDWSTTAKQYRLLCAAFAAHERETGSPVPFGQPFPQPATAAPAATFIRRSGTRTRTKERPMPEDTPLQGVLARQFTPTPQLTGPFAIAAMFQKMFRISCDAFGLADAEIIEISVPEDSAWNSWRENTAALLIPNFGVLTFVKPTSGDIFATITETKATGIVDFDHNELFIIPPDTPTSSTVIFNSFSVAQWAIQVVSGLFKSREIPPDVLLRMATRPNGVTSECPPLVGELQKAGT